MLMLVPARTTSQEREDMRACNKEMYSIGRNGPASFRGFLEVSDTIALLAIWDQIIAN